MICCPDESSGLALRAQARCEAYGHEPGSRCHARGALRPIPGGYPGACGTVILAIVRPGPKGVFRARVIALQSRIPRCHNLADTTELHMIYIHSVIDDRNGNALAARHLVRRFDIGMCIDYHAVEGSFFQVPLRSEDSLARTRPDQFWVAIFHIFALEQSLCHFEYLASASFRRLDKEGISRITHLVLDCQIRCSKHLAAGIHIRFVHELYEQIFRIEYGLLGGGINQHATGKANIRRSPQHSLAIIKGLLPLAHRYAVYLDASFRV